jgi:rhodanese-related sulfurtransferase/catechol 2,3-dioxygenase-like lactoylglutathione lyase family enzyme
MPARPIDSQITFVTVSDLDASGEFYGGVLGLDLVLDQGTCRVYRTTATSYLGICTHREDVSPQGIILTLVSDDVDRWYRELQEAGVAFESAPQHKYRYNIYHVFLRDPDGHLVEIQRFEDCNWAGRRSTDDLLSEARSRISRWSPAKAREAQEKGAIVIDARDSADIEREGSIPGSVVIPLSALEWRVDPTSPFRQDEIVDAAGPLIVVCNDGYSSSLAAARLRELGRFDAGDLIGGFRAWKLDGLPVD